ncbi:MAG: hypothetical protein KGI42_12040 [Xanthomonadaceae bacterium]|nr:hypothetical protein [Xanthomonadaceae bacterium]
MSRLAGLPARAMLALSLLLPHAVRAADPPGMVTLSAAEQVQQGVLTAPLAQAGEVDLPDAVATVRDPSPLLATAATLDSTRAQVRADAAAARAADAEAHRLQALLPKGYVSRRDVQSAEAAAAAARATGTADRARHAAAQADARARWGETLAALAMQGPAALAPFADGQAALVELAWPGSGVAQPPATVALLDPPAAPVTARLLGAAPMTDAVVQGASYFYRADDARALRSGQRLAVGVAADAAGHAVQVPLAAVIWYAGQPWVYAEASPGRFHRVPLGDGGRSGSAWVVDGALRPGERVVVRGAELLLTQELKPPPGAAPAGGDDDDD